MTLFLSSLFGALSAGTGLALLYRFVLRPFLCQVGLRSGSE
jgi:hypothetical protein